MFLYSLATYFLRVSCQSWSSLVCRLAGKSVPDPRSLPTRGMGDSFPVHLRVGRYGIQCQEPVARQQAAPCTPCWGSDGLWGMQDMFLTSGVCHSCLMVNTFSVSLFRAFVVSCLCGARPVLQVDVSLLGACVKATRMWKQTLCCSSAPGPTPHAVLEMREGVTQVHPKPPWCQAQVPAERKSKQKMALGQRKSKGQRPNIQINLRSSASQYRRPRYAQTWAHTVRHKEPTRFF